jgi:anti-sigma factor RsiW
MTVECLRRDIRDALPDLVHDQLDQATRAAVERHIADCEECAAELTLLRSMRAALASEPVVNVARIADAVARVSGHARTDTARHLPVRPRSVREAPRPRRRPAWYGWRAAASIAAVSIGVMSYTLSRDPARQPARAAESSSVAAAPAPTAPSAQATTSKTAMDAAAPSLMLGGEVSDLSESDVQVLLQEIDELEAVPDVEPHPLSSLGQVMEGAL